MKFHQWMAEHAPRDIAYSTSDLFRGWNGALQFGLGDIHDDVVWLRKLVRDEMAARVAGQLTYEYSSERSLMRMMLFIEKLHVQVPQPTTGVDSETTV